MSADSKIEHRGGDVVDLGLAQVPEGCFLGKVRARLLPPPAQQGSALTVTRLRLFSARLGELMPPVFVDGNPFACRAEERAFKAVPPQRADGPRLVTTAIVQGVSTVATQFWNPLILTARDRKDKRSPFHKNA